MLGNRVWATFTFFSGYDDITSRTCTVSDWVLGGSGGQNKVGECDSTSTTVPCSHWLHGANSAVVHYTPVIAIVTVCYTTVWSGLCEL